MIKLLSVIRKSLFKIGNKITEIEKSNTAALTTKIGNGTVLLPGFNLDFRIGWENRKYVEVGEKCIIQVNCIFETQAGHIRIGNNVHIGGATMICRSSIQVEDDVGRSRSGNY